MVDCAASAHGQPHRITRDDGSYFITGPNSRLLQRHTEGPAPPGPPHGRVGSSQLGDSLSPGASRTCLKSACSRSERLCRTAVFPPSTSTGSWLSSMITMQISSGKSARAAASDQPRPWRHCGGSASRTRRCGCAREAGAALMVPSLATARATDEPRAATTSVARRSRRGRDPLPQLLHHQHVVHTQGCLTSAPMGQI